MLKSRSSIAVLGSLTVLAGLFMMTGASQDHSMEDRVAALDKRVASLETQLGNMKAQMTRNHPDQRTEQAAVESLTAINAMLMGGRAMEAKPALAKFMEEYGATKAAATAQSMAQSLVAVGKTVPASWQVESWYQGGAADLAAPGATIVMFWETWCPHCRKAMPSLQATYEKYKSRGLSVVGFTRLSRGGTDQSIRDFIGQNSIRFAVAKESGVLSSYFGVSSIPAASVIKDGMVIWSGHPASISDDMLQEWLGNTAS